LAEAAYFARFAAIDQQFAETRAQLGVKIEAVETKSCRCTTR
jgi:hypothetical protein